MDCCEVAADKLQAEFIYEHVEGATDVTGMRVGSVDSYDDVGIVQGPNKELHEQPAWLAVVASRLVQACNLALLVLVSHVPAIRGIVTVLGGRKKHVKLCEKSREFTYLV